jgi:hypothetical protein
MINITLVHETKLIEKKKLFSYFNCVYFFYREYYRRTLVDNERMIHSHDRSVLCKLSTNHHRYNNMKPSNKFVVVELEHDEHIHDSYTAAAAAVETDTTYIYIYMLVFFSKN